MVKKILTIDGGGIRGIFPASFLAHAEGKIEGKISDYFDLIVGTSTGGIIALGLGLGLSSQEILDFYKKNGSFIFSGNNFLKSVRHWFFPKYEHQNLKLALEEIFEDRKFGESDKRLVVPSLNLDTGKVHIYKTAHHKRFNTDYKKSAVEVALATSAAPSYFPTYITQSGSPMVDGGIWANNPIGLAVVEAIGVLGWEPKNLEILSIGCTSEPIGTGGIIGPFRGKAYWAANAVDLFMQAQSSASLGTAEILTSHDQIIRIDPIVAPKKYNLDSYKAIPSLEGLGESYLREEFPRIKKFFSKIADPFEEFYKVTS